MLIELGWRALLAVPFVVMAWYLFATTSGNPDAGGKRLIGLACAVIVGVLVAPPLAGLAAEPWGVFFHPHRTAFPEPIYSIAEARRKRGQYEEAIEEYQKIAEQFPVEVRPYVAMMEIAFVNLRDSARTDAIAKRGLAALRDETSRMHLLRMHQSIKGTALDDAPPVEDQSKDGAE